MTDLAKTIAPKSDQLNADDLIAGPLTITVTDVRGSDNPDQPVSIHFEGDAGKPYKPCKSMRRVLVHCWKGDGKAYIGRRMTLYRDEGVQFGGIKVGGIRISHLSHIDREVEMALTVTKARRAPYRVRPLRAEVHQAPPRQPPSTPTAMNDRIAADLDAPTTQTWAEAYADGQRDNADRIADADDLRTWWAELLNGEDFAQLREQDKGQALALQAHVQNRLRALKGGAA